MGWTPSRIVLISRGRYDEANADVQCYPGMLLAPQADGGVSPHSVVGGGGPLCIAIEDAMRGGDITQALPVNNATPFYRPAKGDLFLCLLQNGQNVSAQQALMSAGDGTLVAALTSKAYNITAASTAITNTNAETTFSNGSYSIPANILAAGDIVRLRGKATVTGQNGSDTTNVKVYVGANSVALGATNIAANSVVTFDIQATIQTAGASGAVSMEGYLGSGVIGTGTEKVQSVNTNTSLNTAAAVTCKVTQTWNNASTSDTITLDEFEVTIIKAAGFNGLLIAQEAINNTSGAGSSPISGFNSAAFIRCTVV